MLEASPPPGSDGGPAVRSTYAVWEITLRCNLRCIHCGSRAGDARTGELDTAEALDLVRQLAEVGVREVSLIGGEAFLRRDWLDIAAEVSRRGMRCTMTTGGYGLGPKMARRIKGAGIERVSVSVDGLEATHDHLRGRQGSYRRCLVAIRSLLEAGVSASANTQINRLSAPELPRVYEVLRDAGIGPWQTQMTVPMGNAADHHDLLLQPYELLDVFPLLAHIHERGFGEGVRMQPGNNIGYFGPYERRLRARPGTGGKDVVFWSGCTGGVLTLGIEADGTIKPDPSLPTVAYRGGNIRNQSLHDIIFGADALVMNDDRSLAQGDLWGFCSGCEFAEVCRGGDTWTSHVFFDRRGNNPYCHYRSLYHAAGGMRERVVQRIGAEGLPFDNGVFGIERESVGTPLAADDPLAFGLDKVQWPESWLAADPEIPARLRTERDRSIEVWRRRLPEAPFSNPALMEETSPTPRHVPVRPPADPRAACSS